MDILCPQTSLSGNDKGPKRINTFDLYNVTKSQFDNCETGGTKLIITQYYFKWGVIPVLQYITKKSLK